MRRRPLPANTNDWALGNMLLPQDATNMQPLRLGELFPYTSQPAVYDCPSDLSQTNNQRRVRSYSMNGWIGSRYLNSLQGEAGFQTYVKENEMATKGTSGLWLICDEHETTIDDAWFLVTMNDSDPFGSFPATRHSHGYNLNFADGHAEHFALRDPNTQSPNVPVTARNSDWIRLKLVTTMAWGQ